MARIEEIIRRLDSGEAGLRETLDLVKEGRDLVEYCAGELEAVEQGPRGASPRRACGAPRGRPGAAERPVSTFDLLADLPLEVDGYALEGAAGRGLERVRAPDHGRAPDRRRRSRASARTSSTTPRTTSRSRRPAPSTPRAVRTVRPGRVLRAGRLARSVPGGAAARGLAALPTLDVPQRRARPGARAGRAAAARAPRPRAAAGDVRRLAAPRRAADARPDRAPAASATRRCASSSTRRARGRRS